MSKRSEKEEEQSGGAPEWMVTFCDCMTLLLTFFVLLLSFATFHKETLPKLGISFAQALPTIGLTPSDRKEAIWKRHQDDQQVQQTEGTETPQPTRSQSSNFMREKRPLDFRNLKVFTVPSERFFYARGAALTTQGRQTLDALAVFLEFQGGRLVISENGPDGPTELGLSRATAIMEYLVNQGEIDRNCFSITAQSMVREKSRQRQVEITLLDRSIYE